MVTDNGKCQLSRIAIVLWAFNKRKELLTKAKKPEKKNNVFSSLERSILCINTYNKMRYMK